jgi:hypothetical protein
MTLLALITREVERLRRLRGAVVACVPVAVAAVVLVGGARLLTEGRWLTLPAALPVLVWGAAIGAAAVAAHRVRRRLAEQGSEMAVGEAIEREQGLRRGALTGWLEVRAAGGPFAGRAAEQLAARLASVADRPAPQAHRHLMRWAVVATAGLLVAVVATGISLVRDADGWMAIRHPVAAWRGTVLPPLSVLEAPGRLPRGGRARVVIAAEGRRQLRVRWRLTGAGWRDTTLRVDAGRSSVELGPVDADLVLVASDGRTTSDSVRLRVVDRPFLGDVVVRATYPAYLGRPTERLPVDAPMRLPEGTRVRVEGNASETLARVALVSGDGRRVGLRAQGLRFDGEFRPSGMAAWHWEAQGERQEIVDLPAPLEIEVVPDSAPRVAIVEPTGELTVGLEDRVGLEIVAQDDQQLRGVWLRRWVIDAEGREGAVAEFRLSDARDAEWVGGVTQDLGDLALRPGASVRFVAVARDAAAGGREVTSVPLLLRVPTTAEERRAARDVGDAAVAAARAAAQAQATLAERTETAARSRSDRPSADAPSANRSGAQSAMRFEGAEQAKEIADQQRALQERVSGLEEAARDMEDRLRSAGALDTAMARQLQEAQRLLREAMTPEMAEALRRVEQSATELNADRTRQSLADLAAQQQKMREALERSAEMLKRAALEGSMKTVADQASDLARAQQAFADSVAGARPESPPDARRAEALARQSRELSDAMEALKERLAQARARTGAAQADRAESEARRSEAALQEAMRQARDAQGAPAGPRREEAARDARDAAAQAAQAMQQAAEAMQQARSGQVAEWKGELTQAIDRSVQEMMQLAREQDQLANDARQNPADPSLRGRQSALQQGVQTAQQRLAQQARQSALVSPRTEQMVRQAQQQVSEATRDASQAQAGDSPQSMQEAADALRQAAAQLTRDRERATNAQSASGLPELMEQMQELARQQGQLNGQMQGLMPTGQPRGQSGQEGVDAEARARARELARSQREVARALDEVADADPTGRAQEMAREARLLAQTLDQGVVDQAMQARQERLFRRMLDAGRALEQEQHDETQRRESRAARGTARFTPPGGPARGAGADRYPVPTWEELRGLSAEERRLVIDYFRALNAERKP